MIIGGRYFTFTSVYGKKLYWALGACAGIAGFLLFRGQVQASGSAITGALIELVFGFFLLISFLNNMANHRS